MAASIARFAFMINANFDSPIRGAGEGTPASLILTPLLAPRRSKYLERGASATLASTSRVDIYRVPHECQRACLERRRRALAAPGASSRGGSACKPRRQEMGGRARWRTERARLGNAARCHGAALSLPNDRPLPPPPHGRWAAAARTPRASSTCWSVLCGAGYFVRHVQIELVLWAAGYLRRRCAPSISCQLGNFGSRWARFA